MSTALLVVGCGGSARATSLPGLTATRLANLKAIVRRETRLAGDAHPSSVMVFATRWHEADEAVGVRPGNGDQPVYLVVARGHFACYGCNPSSGAGPSRGDLMTLVLARKTLLGLFGGGVGGHVDTKRVGPGLPLAVG